MRSLSADRHKERHAVVRLMLRTTLAAWAACAAFIMLGCSQEPAPSSVQPSPPVVSTATSIPVSVAVVAPNAASKLQEGAKRVEEEATRITPFTNVAPEALKDGYEVSNYRPAVVVFDYDRDGDSDLYITSNARAWQPAVSQRRGWELQEHG